MILRRFQRDDGITELQEFYRHFLNTPYHHWVAVEMGHFLERVEQEVATDQVWYFHTSHHWLHLHPDNETDDVVVSFWATGENPTKILSKIYGLPPEECGRFFITYRIPADESPWPGAKVEMEAGTVSDALKAFEIALARCDRPKPH